ncbi:glycosyltransferase family 4 protein [Paenibacillus sp. MBLB4367]|uniref:glycosyltransferase family 4 protein n=1 Tax=Paenibacillus sp. MBLB4367 TaxID=3384767 RepID=UPI003908349C
MSAWMYVIGFIASCSLAVLLTPLVKKLAFRVGAVSIPNHRSVHTKPMPQMGGLAIFLAFAIVYTVVSLIAHHYTTDVTMALLIGGTIIVIVGAFDDRLALSPKVKLLGQIIAAVVVVSFGLQIDVINIPFTGWSWTPPTWLAIVITVVWIIGVTNAVNLIDGLDGLSAGVSGIATATIMVMALMMPQQEYPIALLCAVLLGSIVGFLFFNFNPAKIFMGDTGALFLGFTLATLSIVGYKQAAFVSFIVPILILGVPISDTLLAIVRRKLNNKPISAPDKGHLHHSLMGLGFSTRKTVLIIYGISILFGLCAVLMSQPLQWWTIVLLAVFFLGMEVGVEALGILSKKRKPVIQLFQRLAGQRSKG